MQFESKITLYDLRVILNNVMIVPWQISIKAKGLDVMDSCRIIDVNEKGNNVTVIYKNDGKSEMLTLMLRDVEFIEFESFYTYRGCSSRIFIVE